MDGGMQEKTGAREKYFRAPSSVLLHSLPLASLASLFSSSNPSLHHSLLFFPVISPSLTPPSFHLPDPPPLKLPLTATLPLSLSSPFVFTAFPPHTSVTYFLSTPHHPSNSASAPPTLRPLPSHPRLLIPSFLRVPPSVPPSPLHLHLHPPFKPLLSNHHPSLLRLSLFLIPSILHLLISLPSPHHIFSLPDLIILPLFLPQYLHL